MAMNHQQMVSVEKYVDKLLEAKQEQLEARLEGVISTFEAKMEGIASTIQARLEGVGVATQLAADALKESLRMLNKADYATKDELKEHKAATDIQITALRLSKAEMDGKASQQDVNMVQRSATSAGTRSWISLFLALAGLLFGLAKYYKG